MFTDILILRGGALGDFLLTLPALRQIRKRWPDAQLTLVGNASAAALALRGGEIDVAFSQHEARWAALYGAAPLTAELAEFLRKKDLIVCFWPDPDGEISARFPLHPQQTFLSAPARPQSHPAARHFCEALAPLGIRNPDTFEYCLHGFKHTLSQPGKSTLALHPGSSSAARNWPASHWKELGSSLLRRGHSLLLITGEADEAQRIELSSLDCEHANGLDLTSLALRMASCDFYLGHDTGVSHLAAALGLPALILFGPSDPKIWAPQGHGVRILCADSSLPALQPEHVLRAILEHPHFPEGRFQ